MNKPIYLCEGLIEEQKTQCRYTPDAGLVEGPVFCGVCESETIVRRNLSGPRSFVEALTNQISKKTHEPHDYFACPYCELPWHLKVVALREEASKTVSTWLKTMFLTEARLILEENAQEYGKKC